ncbi:MAG: type II toxin-antitoxin system prevent-host-death family antitoxin [bacterium]|nr:type II toxin-antitoxin system prevent-host-death family antitoxin [bacterium]
MDTISYTTARKNLAKTMEKVCHDHNPVVITRQTAEAVVLLSLEDYHAMEETAYLLRSSKNAARLAQAIEEIETGKAKERSLLE